MVVREIEGYEYLLNQLAASDVGFVASQYNNPDDASAPFTSYQLQSGLMTLDASLPAGTGRLKSKIILIDDFEKYHLVNRVSTQKNQKELNEQNQKWSEFCSSIF